jgi:primosomal protein N' (replication factor Y) (superfamily II helicase)
VAVQHSGLSPGERADQWHRIRAAEVDIVVGTRSAVFAPLDRLGLIIVDEEHDASFKQDETPRYNGRDVAVMRARNEQALIVLGSATPSLESSQNAEAGRYSRVLMERRVENRPLATVNIVDMRAEYAEEGPDVILSRPLKAAIEARLRSGQQSLILLNRRGLSTAVFCRQCGATIECPNCSVSLIVHTEGRERRHRARCHYCNFSMLVPNACPNCAGPYLERRGFGTERVTDEIAALWPEARVARLDRDTVRRRGAAATILKAMAGGRVDLLVGTQMIAKGHDFPGVTLVGVISADVGLGLADFRAGERTFQLLTQVAGRAGRGNAPGEAIIQTLYPNHYSIRHACRQDYGGFFADELVYRRSMNYPPLTALVNLVVRGRDAGAAMGEAADLARTLRKSAAAGNFSVLGPAPAPVPKLRGEHRAQIFLKGPNRGAMRRAVLSALDAAPELRRRVAVDVDPLSIL